MERTAYAAWDGHDPRDLCQAGLSGSLVVLCKIAEDLLAWRKCKRENVMNDGGFGARLSRAACASEAGAACVRIGRGSRRRSA